MRSNEDLHIVKPADRSLARRRSLATPPPPSRESLTQLRDEPGLEDDVNRGIRPGDANGLAGTAQLAGRLDRSPRLQGVKAVELAVDAQGLVKQFGDKTAVDHLDLQVPVGSWFGVVGPNGAGKTTTIRMIVGLLRPDEGNVVVNGLKVWPDPTDVKRNIGVLPDDLRLFERLSGAELLLYIGLLRELPRELVLSRLSLIHI